MAKYAYDQDDSDENNCYEPDMEYSEINGLPDEDEIPANRKIQFSRAPIKVKFPTFFSSGLVHFQRQLDLKYILTIELCAEKIVEDLLIAFFFAASQ